MIVLVDKKVVAGVAIVAGVATAAVLLKGAKAPPIEEGTPEGEVTIEVTPLGRPERYSLEDVQGAWGVGATVKVNGKCTGGFPVPSMLLELYDKGVKRKETTIAAVTLGTTYALSDTMGVADVGDHTVYGRMVLTNPFGSYEFTTATQSFSIGAAPPGEVTIEVILT